MKWLLNPFFFIQFVSCYFSGGKSSSKSQADTKQEDNRVVADNGSYVNGGIKLGNSNKNTVINVADLGSIDQAFKFATAANEGVNKTFLNVADQGFDLITEGFNFLNDNKAAAADAYKQSSSAIQNAYQDSKGQTVANQYIAYGALAAMVATAYFVSKK